MLSLSAHLIVSYLFCTPRWFCVCCSFCTCPVSVCPSSNAHRWMCGVVSSWRRRVTLKFCWACTTEQTDSDCCWRGGKEKSEITLSWPQKRWTDQGLATTQLRRWVLSRAYQCTLSRSVLPLETARVDIEQHRQRFVWDKAKPRALLLCF